VDRGTRRRRHHPDAPGQRRQRSLARRIEESLGFEAAAKLLERELERAAPARLELANDDLEIAARLVDRDVPVDQHLEAVLGLEGESAGSAAKERTAHPAGVVFEREVAVTRARDVDVGELAHHPQATDALFEQPREAAEQFAHGVDDFAIDFRVGHAPPQLVRH